MFNFLLSGCLLAPHLAPILLLSYSAAKHSRVVGGVIKAKLQDVLAAGGEFIVM